MDRALLLDLVVLLAVIVGAPYLGIRAFRLVREDHGAR